MAWIRTQEAVEKMAVMVNSKEVEFEVVASFKEATKSIEPWVKLVQNLQKEALVSLA